MAKNQRDPRREAFWRDAMKRQGSSGLSVRAFCRRESLAETSFFAWRRTIRERDAEQPGREPPAFVPAVVTAEARPAASLTIESPSGHVLRLPASTPAAWVAELLDALRPGAGR